MSGIEKDLGPKGFAVVEAAVNENPDLPGFIQRFQPPFPLGTASGEAALKYLEWPPEQRPLVPLMVFIDRQGMIQAQYSGMDEKFFDDNLQDQHIREVAEKLLAEKGGPAPKKSTKSVKRPTK